MLLNLHILLLKSTINFVHSHGLNHHQFRDFMLEIEVEYSDLLYPHSGSVGQSVVKFYCNFWS